MRNKGSALMCVPYHDPIREGDSESQTWGCRAANRYCCSNYMFPDVCAFTRKDTICRQPSTK
jgi:hypothetical protein